MKRETKKMNSYSTQFPYLSFPFIFLMLLIYRIIEYVHLRLMLSVMKP